MLNIITIMLNIFNITKSQYLDFKYLKFEKM